MYTIITELHRYWYRYGRRFNTLAEATERRDKFTRQGIKAEIHLTAELNATYGTGKYIKK